MKKEKFYFRIMYSISAICWIATIIPTVYVLFEAFFSMDGTMHGFNGKMLYGIPAFMDTVLVYIVFGFPFFLLWGICLFGAIITTVWVIYRKRH